MKHKKLITLLLTVVVASGLYYHYWVAQTVLRIYDYHTKEIYLEVPAKTGDQLFFGWLHSWDLIPWHEYFHIASDNTLVLDTISFTAFGAGIPENKGKKVRIENGIIYMEEIDQVFTEFTWLNSHFANKDIKLNNQLIAAGSTLPDLTRLNLVVEPRGWCWWQKNK